MVNTVTSCYRCIETTPTPLQYYSVIIVCNLPSLSLPRSTQIKISAPLSLLFLLHRRSLKMSDNSEILTDFPPFLRVHKSGHVHRLVGTDTVPAGLDPSTGVTSKDVTINSDVSARLYLPKTSTTTQKLPILVYIHGGGFMIESPFSPVYHSHLNSLVSQANLVALSVHYRLAPEHLLPAAYDDSWAAFQWAVSPDADPWLTQFGDTGRVFVAGDSAGANIAHHVAMRADKIEGMILIHPYFWGTQPIGSEVMRDPKERQFYEDVWKMVNSEGAHADDPMLNVMAENAPSLKGLPCERVMVCVAGKDALAERGRAYYEALKGSGWEGEVELVDIEEVDHCFHLEKPEVDEAKGLMEKMVAFFAK